MLRRIQDIIDAWKNPARGVASYVPPNPAGFVELDDDDLEGVGGGTVALDSIHPAEAVMIGHGSLEMRDTHR